MSTWKLQHRKSTLKNREEIMSTKEHPDINSGLGRQKKSPLAGYKAPDLRYNWSWEVYFQKNLERIHSLKQARHSIVYWAAPLKSGKPTVDSKVWAHWIMVVWEASIISAGYDFLCCEKRLGLCARDSCGRATLLWEARGIDKQKPHLNIHQYLTLTRY